jgi:hypothetical protein
VKRGVSLVLGFCIFLFFVSLPSGSAQASSTSDCTLGPCIDVLTDPRTGEIIGLGTAVTPGSAARRTTVTKRAKAKKSSAPIAKPVINPICTVAQLATFTCLKTVVPVVVAPLVPRAITTPPKPTTISTDEVRRALPRAQPGFQPASGAVVNIPVIFWSGILTPARFTMTLLGHSVDLNMNARFLWSWGDGTSLATTSVGAPFPVQTLVHTYSAPGRYRVSVATTWSGSAVLGLTELQIVGAPIESQDQLEIFVGQAPTKLTPVQ